MERQNDTGQYRRLAGSSGTRHSPPVINTSFITNLSIVGRLYIPQGKEQSHIQYKKVVKKFQ